MRTPEDLIGKRVCFYVLAAKGRKGAYGGFRTGEVVSVDNGPRKGFRGVTVMYPQKKVDRYSVPVRLNITLQELTMPNMTCTGVLWFGKLRPLIEWLKGGDS